MSGLAPAARRLELADVFRAHMHRLKDLSPLERKAARAIVDCRTEALGGHVQECDECGHKVIQYNSCRNRHCPKCGGLDKVRWLEARKEDLLPVEYHHVVFTIPEELNVLFLPNARMAYGLLFKAAAETLLEVAANPRHLGAKIGFTAVLHTWTQKLLYHPHIHCIVPGGGPSPTGDRWISTKPGFFLPVRILSTVFRGKLLSKLEKASRGQKIRFPEDRDIAPVLREAARKDWVVYSKPPVAGPTQVLDYLSRYTHRIAISSDRLVSMEGDQVTFRWKDRAHGNRPRTATLSADEFLRRFLLHVLPLGLVRIRHYGFLANALRGRAVPKLKALLGVPRDPIDPVSPEDRESWQELFLRVTGRDVEKCTVCHVGRMHSTMEIPAAVTPWRLPTRGAAS